MNLEEMSLDELIKFITRRSESSRDLANIKDYTSEILRRFREKDDEINELKEENKSLLGGTIGSVAQMLFFDVVLLLIIVLVMLCFCGIILLFIKSGRYLVVHINAALHESTQSILAKKFSLPGLSEKKQEVVK